ncbi:MAG TPA: glycoside hydrolase family 95 protein [Prolixibacteraceae bacterium]|nr:glycoside hydrolase family 95 protein [Prolixibacteraceae bacterium]HQJ84656.1 glycoside hydrolase family 95 protein [Prolixibacteraceae bacterium]
MRLKVFMLYTLVVFFTSATKGNDNDLKLWYGRPAEKWTEALPVGNGSLGAMIFGGAENERIQFNEETLWTGAPHDYSHPGASAYLDTIRQLLFQGRQKDAEALAMKEFMSVPLGQKAYQPFGDLKLYFPGHGDFSRYSRELDLRKALHRVTYQSGGVTFTRETFASRPDRAIVIRLSADRKKGLGFSMGLDALHEEKMVKASGNTLRLDVQVKEGALRGVAFVRVVTDGTTEVRENRLFISGAQTATLVLTAATNYVTYRDVSGNPEQIARQQLQSAGPKKFKTLLRRHLADYTSLFNRFDVSFGTNSQALLPTNQRIIDFSKTANDPQLLALYIQYGRYLLISSSRPGTQPANLQGIWNEQLRPPWDSKWTVNINAEMNYWPAEVTGLPECHEALFQMVEECAEAGKTTAREHYNCPGWVLHHNTDIWRGTAPINASDHGIWVTGGAWLSLHLWEHFLFTQDREFLAARAYPVMRGAAEFFTRFLVRDPVTGKLISAPSNSPENGGLVAGPAMDHQIIRSLFKACIEASSLLNTDTEFAGKLQKMVPEIAPDRIGRHGQLQEWVEDKDDPNNKHRHVSHLWAVHPGSEITWNSSPELMKAARQSLLFRGDEGTGWSLAWKINFWARFLDGNHAYNMVKLLFRPVQIDKEVYAGGGGSYTNLFDAHPPFQIDGNFGAPAGMVEMLIQSHAGEIHILPALPDALPDGFIKGVRARGGFVLDFEWKSGKLQKLKVRSIAGQPCKLSYAGKTISFDTAKNKSYSFDGSLEN